MILDLLPVRNDDQGKGHFRASRGRRKHNGIDKACYPGTMITAPVSGIVTKLGYPYGSGEGGARSTDPFWYVEVTRLGHKHRMFYITPTVEVGEKIRVGDVIGIVQDLTRRYPGMITHCHYEIMVGKKYLNPGD